jgi:putative oxidoreductase
MRRRRLGVSVAMTVLILMTVATGCVQKAYDRTVIFRVDVSRVPDVQSVGVRGANQPLSWDKDTPMVPVPDSAGLYTATVTAHTGGLMTEVKFVVNGTFEFSTAQNQENRRVSLPRTTTGGDTLVYRAVYDQR